MLFYNNLLLIVLMNHSSKQKTAKRSARSHQRKIKMSATAQGLTSQAGLLPVVKYLNRIGFEKIISRNVPHKRGDNAEYHLSDVIQLTVVGLIGGGLSMAKITAVWADSVLRKVAGWTKIPVATTTQRIFKEVNDEQISQLESVNHTLRAQLWRRALRSGVSKVGIKPVHWIDVDSTVDTVCGHQEGSAKGYNPKKRGAKSYHSQLAFLAESKEIIHAWFRTGSAYTSNGVVEFTKQLLAHLPNRMRIIFRADSGYFVGTLMDLLDKRGHGYLIKVKLKNLSGILESQNWSPIEGQRAWEQCDFKYSCGGWSQARRFVAVRTLNEKPENTVQADIWGMQEYDYFCYVTTEKLSPWQAHKTYGARATCETWIEESKGQMGLGKIRTKSFLANAALFHCAVLAYNTLRWMTILSNNPSLRRWEPETIRTYLVRVAGKLLTGNNQLTIKTPANHLYSKEWDDWVAVGLAS